MEHSYRRCQPPFPWSFPRTQAVLSLDCTIVSSTSLQNEVFGSTAGHSDLTRCRCVISSHLRDSKLFSVAQAYEKNLVARLKQSVDAVQ